MLQYKKNEYKKIEKGNPYQACTLCINYSKRTAVSLHVLHIMGIAPKNTSF